MIALPASSYARAAPGPRVASIAAALLLVALGGLSFAHRPLPPSPTVRLTITLNGGLGADALAVDAPLGHVAVGDSLDGAVRLFDDRDGRLLHTIGLGAAVASQALAVDTRVHHLFVAGQAADGSGSHLWTLDTRTGALLQATRLAGVVAGIGVDEDAGWVVVADEEGARVALLDTRTGRVQRSARIGRAPLATVVDGSGGRAYVVASGTYRAGYPAGEGAQGAVSVLDTRTGRIQGAIAVGALPGAIAVDNAAGLAVVANGGEGTVSVLTARGGVLRGVTVPVGVRPSAVAVDERTGRAYVVNAGDNTVSVLDIRRGAVVRTIRVSVSPRAIAIDNARGLVLVAADGPLDAQGYPVGPGVVDVLDASSGIVVRTIGVGVAPRAIAVDERGGRAIVVNSGGVVDTPSGWATGWALRLRRWLPWAPVPPPDPPAGRAPASVTILDLPSTR